MLQKRNSVEQKGWGCSAFEVLALVAIERHDRVKSVLRLRSVQASAKSAILHSVLIALLVAIRPHYVNIAWERAFALVYLSTLFYL